MATSTNSLIRVTDVCKEYNGGSVHALSHCNLSVKKGEVVAIIGPSGSGKSTLLRCLNLLEQPTSGTIYFKDVALNGKKVNLDLHRREMGMVFQHFNLFPHMTVKKNITRRDVLAMAGCGVAGLVVGGALASWGVTQESIASGRIELRTTPTKMIVTDRARCSGCQRCEMMCTLKNDGRVCQHIARVRVWDNYYWGKSADTGDGSFGDGKGACEFTVEHCKQCADPQCVKYCPVHAIYADEKTGARTVDTKKCIGCGMCSQACPLNMPRVDTETGVSTKCISCGRCAEQCPNGAIQFIDWQDIAQKIIDEGIVRTTTAVTA